MDESTDATTEASQSDNTILFVSIGLAVGIILLLGLVVLLQNKKIRNLQKPKFGFLGKPLSILAVAIMLGSGGYGAYYLRNEDTTQVTEISADTKAELEISYRVVTQTARIYNLQAVPILEDIAWGGNDELQFDIIWEIKNSKITNKFEYNRSKTNPSGIDLNLEKGENVITATIFLENKVITDSMTIFVEN